MAFVDVRSVRPLDFERDVDKLLLPNQKLVELGDSVFDVQAVYTAVKYWGPMVAFMGLLWKIWKSTKKDISVGLDTILNNHLQHIQEATTETVAETKATNALLAASAVRDIEVAQQVEEVKQTLVEQEGKTRAHEEKALMVWQGVVNTLTVLEDRSRSKTPRRPTRRG